MLVTRSKADRVLCGKRKVCKYYLCDHIYHKMVKISEIEVKGICTFTVRTLCFLL